MRILIDECVAFSVFDLLQTMSAEVDHIKTLSFSGLKNGEVYELALNNYNIFITNDRHFRRENIYPVTETLGIIYLRVDPSYPGLQASALENLFSRASLKDLIGKLVMVRRNDFEIRKARHQ